MTAGARYCSEFCQLTRNTVRYFRIWALYGNRRGEAKQGGTPEGAPPYRLHLQCAVPSLARPDTDGFADRRHEYLAVADRAGLRQPHDGVDRPLNQRVGHHDLDLDLGDEFHDVLRAAVDLLVPLLPAEPLDLRDRHALHAQFGQPLFHFVQLKRFDDRLDLLHN